MFFFVEFVAFYISNGSENYFMLSIGVFVCPQRLKMKMLQTQKRMKMKPDMLLSLPFPHKITLFLSTVLETAFATLKT